MELSDIEMARRICHPILTSRLILVIDALLVGVGMGMHIGMGMGRMGMGLMGMGMGWNPPRCLHADTTVHHRSSNK